MDPPTHHFVGLHGSGSSNNDVLVDLSNATNLTIDLLDSFEQPPAGPFVFTFPHNYYLKTGEHVQMAINRLIKNRKEPCPLISVTASDLTVGKATEFMNALNLTVNAYGVIKIRRNDRSSLLNCTEPKEVVNQFYLFYRDLNEADRMIPWLVFGYVESSYWERLAEELFRSPHFQGSNPPKFLFERDMFLQNNGIHTAIADNYLLMQVLLRVMSSAKYSIGTYWHEGKNAHFCMNSYS